MLTTQYIPINADEFIKQCSHNHPLRRSISLEQYTGYLVGLRFAEKKIKVAFDVSVLHAWLGYRVLLTLRGNLTELNAEIERYSNASQMEDYSNTLERLHQSKALLRLLRINTEDAIQSLNASHSHPPLENPLSDLLGLEPGRYSNEKTQDDFHCGKEKAYKFWRSKIEAQYSELTDKVTLTLLDHHFFSLAQAIESELALQTDLQSRRILRARINCLSEVRLSALIPLSKRNFDASIMVNNVVEGDLFH